MKNKRKPENIWRFRAYHYGERSLRPLWGDVRLTHTPAVEFENG